MKDINIADVILENRKLKGVTQDELANYIGVSKASVSKWETGQSYPDITFLPLLASYFNISIDDLMGYEPQMIKEDIKKLYNELSVRFTKEPIENVLEDCRTIVKKYFSCYPLLFYIGQLYINYYDKTIDEKGVQLIQEAQDLFAKIRNECDDIELLQKARFAEAFCSITKNDPDHVLLLLEETSKSVSMPPETLVAMAYQMKGQSENAIAILQVGLYQNVIIMLNILGGLIPLYLNVPQKYEEVIERMVDIMDIFNVKQFHLGLFLQLYLTAAAGYSSIGNDEKALEMLSEFATQIEQQNFPQELQGDDFFDLIDNWLQDLDSGTEMPKSGVAMKNDLVGMVSSSPAFSSLVKNKSYENIVNRLTKVKERR